MSIRLQSMVFFWLILFGALSNPAVCQVDTNLTPQVITADFVKVDPLVPEVIPNAGLPVIFAEDTLFSIYSPLGEFEASERVATILVRLKKLARNDAPLDSMRLVENEGVTDVLLDTLRVLSVTAIDASSVGQEKSTLAEEYRQIVIRAVEARRSDLSWQGILRNLGVVGGLFVGLLILFWVMMKIFPKTYVLLEKWEGSVIRPLRFRGQKLLSANTISGLFMVIFKGIRLAISLTILYFFITYSLSLFPWTWSWNVAPILRGFLFSVLVTAAAVGIIKGVNSFFATIGEKVEKWRGTFIKAIRIKTVEVFSEERIVELIHLSKRIVRFALYVVVAYFYMTIIFSFFTFSQTWGATLLGYILDPLKNVFLAVVSYLPNLFFILVIVFVTRYVVKLIGLLFSEIGKGTITLSGFSTEWADPTYKIVRFLVIAFSVIVIFPYLPGSDSAAFQGISVFIGVLFSLGSSSAIANIVAGVVLTYMRPFRIGDRVRVADTIGDVIEKTLLVTRIRTPKNVDVSVPNGMVLGSHIINYSSSAKKLGLILHTTVTIGYDAPWKQVHELLVSAANATEHILKQPAPYVLQTSLDDFYPSYELNAFTDQPNLMPQIYSGLHQSIQDKFNEAGVEILSPHYSAIRDGNAVTHPPDYLPKDYKAPGFRIFPLGNILK